MRQIFVYLFVLIACFAVCVSKAAAEREVPELSIECRMDNSDFYERQPVSIVVTLRSSTPDIAFADVVSAVSLKKGEFATVQKVSPAGSGYKEVVDGKVYYCIPLETYMVTMADKGSYVIEGGEYSVGVACPVVIDDPFWGRTRTAEVKRFKVPVRKKSFKVRDLPVPPDSVDFSGSVGKFTIETILPKGDIFVNEEAVAVVVIKGAGLIADATLPEYREAFQNGLRLKSVSESRNVAHDKGKMISELSLECTFIPERREGIEIGEVSFSYFDPEEAAYRIVRSNPVKVEVKSSTAKRESISV